MSQPIYCYEKSEFLQLNEFFCLMWVSCRCYWWKGRAWGPLPYGARWPWDEVSYI